MMKSLRKLSQRRVYQIALCLVIAVFLLLNLCASMVGEKFSIKLDMTGEKLYEFSKATYDIGGAISEETNIYVVAKEGDYPSMFNEVISRYAKLSPNIKVSYMDPYENPLFIDHYKQQGYGLAENDILVTGKSGNRQIAYDDMLVSSDDQVSGINIEQKLTSALTYVNSNETLTAAFTVGHNERTSAALESVFTDNSYEVSRLSLSAERPEDVDLVVIASPAKDFEASEAAKLEDYMKSGGRVMLFLEPGVGSYPNLTALLSNWNLSLQDNVIFEEKAYVSDNPINIIPMYASHQINAYFAENPYYVVMPAARGIEVKEGGGQIKAEAVLLSTPDSYAKTGVQYTDAKKETGDVAGPFVLAAVAEKAVVKDGKEKTGGLFLAGSKSLYADDIMSVETYANREFLTQAVNYLTKTEGGVYIPAKTLTKPPLAITMQKTLLIGFLLVVLLPFGFLARGLVVSIKRKHL